MPSPTEDEDRAMPVSEGTVRKYLNKTDEVRNRSLALFLPLHSHFSLRGPSMQARFHSSFFPFNAGRRLSGDRRAMAPL